MTSGKNLICCKTAWDDFEKIVTTLGGPMETKRTEDLKQRVRIYSDNIGGKLHFLFLEIEDLLCMTNNNYYIVLLGN